MITLVVLKVSSCQLKLNNLRKSMNINEKQLEFTVFLQKAHKDV